MPEDDKKQFNVYLPPDLIRAVKIAKDRGIGGPLISASSYLMKSPPEQFPDDQARDNVERFIAGELAR